MKAVINIKTDKEVKKNAQKIAAELGVSLSAVINAHLRQFIRDKEIHFSITPKMSPNLEKILGDAEVDIQKKRNITPVFSSKKEIRKHLSSL